MDNMNYNLKLIKREEICRDTYGLYFDIKNSGFDFKAGQFVQVSIPGFIAADGKDNQRYYSIANAPGESDFIEIIIRKSGSDFSNHVVNIPLGSELSFGEARGEIKSENIKDNTVFIAGGTGITPVRSILKDFQNKHINKHLTLFYSNRSREYAAFINELTTLGIEKKDFTFIPIFEDEENYEELKSENGFFSEEIFKKYISEPLNHFYYVTGPPLMLSEAIKVLVNAGVPDDKIFIERV